MRSFSNILPNFATNLHLLVDSILAIARYGFDKSWPKLAHM